MGKRHGPTKRHVARRAAKADRDERIIEGRVAGLSYRKLAQLFKVVSYGRSGRSSTGGCIPYYTDSVLSALKKKRGKILTFL